MFDDGPKVIALRVQQAKIVSTEASVCRLTPEKNASRFARFMSRSEGHPHRPDNIS